MKRTLQAWLRLLRIVNLPTVPGDVLVGVAAALAWTSVSATVELTALPIVLAVLSSCFIYLFGLVQNDILGAKTDVGRPIPEGLVSRNAARTACAVCWWCAGLCCLRPGVGLPLALGVWFFAMTVLVSAYNATKNPLLMGLCRGVNVLLGALSVVCACNLWNTAHIVPVAWASLGCAAVWTAYIAGVTKYSEGEETDPARKARVGFLIGALVYLQLGALLFFYVVHPTAYSRGLLVAGAVLLLVLRLMKRTLPKVSAS